ncbi:hypothetical protein PCANC_19143 [Puccinia coronata f. sp. avenae]|uniref:DNA 3'-5' helicase n=1 Tax=Puccinia coronata f. sp. avenae TaxID=200324 RepID=A0A2N5TSW7_9BASI|nr:hypothetical protein PCANC_19143 [Puccinia coronata f. sp. avenae]
MLQQLGQASVVEQMQKFLFVNSQTGKWDTPHQSNVLRKLFSQFGVAGLTVAQWRQAAVSISAAHFNGLLVDPLDDADCDNFMDVQRNHTSSVANTHYGFSSGVGVSRDDETHFQLASEKWQDFWEIRGKVEVAMPINPINNLADPFKAAHKALSILTRNPRAQFVSPFQEQWLTAVFAHEQDLLVIAKTGGGKSLAYMLPPLVLPHEQTVVIQPLRALVNQTVDDLSVNHISVQRYQPGHPIDPSASVIVALSDDAAKLDFINQLRQHPPSQILIDEVHSLLDDTYRSYIPGLLNLRQLSSRFVFTSASLPPAQANDLMAIDFSMRSLKIFRESTFRPELQIEVSSPMELLALHHHSKELISEHVKLPEDRAIIFIENRDHVDALAAQLDAFKYHSTLDEAAKDAMHRDWRCTKQAVMVATSGFGAGINYAHVRLVIIFGLPCRKDATRAYQQLGRAGRDGQPAFVSLVPTTRQTKLPDEFQEQLLNPARCAAGVFSAWEDTSPTSCGSYPTKCFPCSRCTSWQAHIQPDKRSLVLDVPCGQMSKRPRTNETQRSIRPMPSSRIGRGSCSKPSKSPPKAALAVAQPSLVDTHLPDKAFPPSIRGAPADVKAMWEDASAILEQLERTTGLKSPPFFRRSHQASATPSAAPPRPSTPPPGRLISSTALIPSLATGSLPSSSQVPPTPSQSNPTPPSPLLESSAPPSLPGSLLSSIQAPPTPSQSKHTPSSKLLGSSEPPSSTPTQAPLPSSGQALSTPFPISTRLTQAKSTHLLGTSIAQHSPSTSGSCSLVATATHIHNDLPTSPAHTQPSPSSSDLISLKEILRQVDHASWLSHRNGKPCLGHDSRDCTLPTVVSSIKAANEKYGDNTCSRCGLPRDWPPYTSSIHSCPIAFGHFASTAVIRAFATHPSPIPSLIGFQPTYSKFIEWVGIKPKAKPWSNLISTLLAIKATSATRNSSTSPSTSRHPVHGNGQITNRQVSAMTAQQDDFLPLSTPSRGGLDISITTINSPTQPPSSQSVARRLFVDEQSRIQSSGQPNVNSKTALINSGSNSSSLASLKVLVDQIKHHAEKYGKRACGKCYFLERKIVVHKHLCPKMTGFCIRCHGSHDMKDCHLRYMSRSIYEGTVKKGARACNACGLPTGGNNTDPLSFHPACKIGAQCESGFADFASQLVWYVYRTHPATIARSTGLEREDAEFHMWLGQTPNHASIPPNPFEGYPAGQVNAPPHQNPPGNGHAQPPFKRPCYDNNGGAGYGSSAQLPSNPNSHNHKMNQAPSGSMQMGASTNKNQGRFSGNRPPRSTGPPFGYNSPIQLNSSGPHYDPSQQNLAQPTGQNLLSYHQPPQGSTNPS